MIQLLKPLQNRLSNSRTLSSSLWVTLEVVFSQALRLCGNLILTRLLVPEYFGIMAIVMSVAGFFYMVSDIGLVPSIVNTSRSEDKAFMETAWTIQIIRSALLATALLLFAYPVSLFYEDARLFPVLCLLAFTVFAGGFNSTSIVLEQKHLRQGRLAIVNIGIQLISLTSMLILAYLFRNIWALILGQVVSTFCLLFASYKFFSPHHSKFRLEKEATKEIVHFGKWILLASLFGYFASRGGPLVMGTILTLEQMGIYMIAGTLATMTEMLANNISGKVLQPRYRQIINEKKGFSGLHRVRFNFNLCFLPTCIILAAIGSVLMDFLYDERYADGGWILQMLALGRVGTILTNNARPILVSLGDSKRLMYNQAASAITTISLMMTGGYLAGFEGMVLANACSPFIHYLFVSLLLRKHKVYVLPFDLPLIAISITSIFLIWYITDSRTLEILSNIFQAVDFSSLNSYLTPNKFAY